MSTAITRIRLLFGRPITSRDIDRLIGNPLRYPNRDVRESVKVRPETVERVKQVQRDRGVMVDGVLGPQTWCEIGRVES